MNKMTKIVVMGASVVGLVALTACQSTTNTKDKDHPQRMMKEHHVKGDRKMPPEQREKFKQSRAEHREVMKQIQNICENKTVNTAVQLKAGEKTIEGTCVMTFKPELKKVDKLQRHENRPMRGHVNVPMKMQRGEILTDDKRAEMVKDFDRRLAERQAKQQAVIKACEGKKDGSAVQIKAGAQIIDGKCEVRFQPKMKAPTPQKAA